MMIKEKGNLSMQIKILVAIIAILIVVPSCFAQEYTSTIASTVKITESVANGDVICSTLEGFRRCDANGNASMYGVVAFNPAAYINDTSIESGVPVVTNGVTMVRVSTINGVIAKGQYVTSSSLPGIAQVASENGYVLGIAQDNYNATDVNEIGNIPVVLNIHLEAGLSNTRSNLIAVLSQSKKAAVFAPLDSLRYLLAALLVLASFMMAFVYFGRTSAVGVEAIGRNPLAKGQIQRSMIVHFIVTFIVILIGIGCAYLILTL